MTDTHPTDRSGPRHTTRADSIDAAEGTMADVSHTHPHTGESFGDAYRRGVVVADGGGPTDASTDLMKDVDHTPPHGDGAKAVWERGRKRTDAVDGTDTDADDGAAETAEIEDTDENAGNMEQTSTGTHGRPEAVETTEPTDDE